MHLISSQNVFLLAAAEALPDALEGAPADISAEACGMGVVWARCKLLFCRDVGGVSRAGTATFAYLCY